MFQFYALLRNDIRNIFRDRMLIIFCFLPLIMVWLMRYVLPFVSGYYPILKDYEVFILAVLCLVSVIGPAFLSSMIMLDEKDENLFTVIKVMPVSPGFFIFFRLGFITILGFGASLFTMLFSGTEGITLYNSLLLSLQTGMIVPIITLICVTFARNKIEGVTFIKGLNFLSIIPLVLIFTKPSWEFMGGIIPFYWVYKAFENLHLSVEMGLYAFGGIGVNLLFITGLYYQFRSKL